MGFPIDDDFSLFDVESEHEDAKLHPRLGAHAFTAGKKLHRYSAILLCIFASHQGEIRVTLMTKMSEECTFSPQVHEHQ